MTPSRLNRIRILFSNYQPKSLEFFGLLSSLLNQDPNSRTQSDQITFLSSVPINAQPGLILGLEQIGFPKIILDTDERIYVHIGHLFIKSSALELQSETIPLATRRSREGCSPMEEIYRGFRGHVVRLDHAGVDIPTNMLSMTSWNSLLLKIGSISNLYRYPTGEAWPFIIPTSQSEFEQEITRFTNVRSPKFEFAYDGFNTLPGIHFAIQTDLPQAEVEARIPPPAGFNLPGTDTCRSVHIDHPWPNLMIRFDFYYKPNGSNPDWDSGKWLVAEGGRIK